MQTVTYHPEQSSVEPHKFAVNLGDGDARYLSLYEMQTLLEAAEMAIMEYHSYLRA